MGQTPSTNSKHYKARMIKAVQNGDFDLLQKTLMKSGVGINQVKDHRGSPLLCLAVRKGDLKMVSLLLEEGGQKPVVKSNPISKYKHFLNGVIAEHPEQAVLTKLYMNLEPSIEQALEYGLCDRCGGKTVGVSKCDSVVDLDVADMKGLSPVHITAINGTTDIAEVLIEKGADVNKPDSLEASPLHAAAAYAHEAICNLLLDNGAFANACEKSGLTPLHLAIMTGSVGAVRILVNRGAWSYIPDHEGRSPVHFASVLSTFRGLDDIVRTDRSVILNLLILKHGGKVTYQDDTQCSPMSYALIRDNQKLVRMYLDWGMMLEKNDLKRMQKKHEKHLESYHKELDYEDTKVPSLYKNCRRTVMGALAENPKHLTDSHLYQAVDTLEIPTIVKGFLKYNY